MKLRQHYTNAWFPPFRCRSALPFRHSRYVNSVRITLLTWKNPLRWCR